MAFTREQLAERCASTSFDKMRMDYQGKKVVYTHSFRDTQREVLEEFTTELVFSELQPRPISPAEERALLAFGLCHSTYVFLVAAKKTQLLQVRAAYFAPDELAFFTGALSGALAEYFYLADLDLALLKLECCCEPPPSQPAALSRQQLLPAEAQPAAASAARAADPAPACIPPPATPAATEPSDPAPAPSQDAAPASEEQRRHDREPPQSSTAAAAAAGAAQPAAAGRPDPGAAGAGARPPRVLVPFGGGKDSTLLMELLAGMGVETGWVYYGEWVGSWEVYGKFALLAAASPAAGVVLAEQGLEPCLERLKQLNLVPDLPFHDYTAYVSFYTFASAFVALQQGYDYICVGNEYSANAINTTHPKYGYPVNHQYEKSFAAEVAFHAYLRAHVHPALHYFSGLQHMTELEIAARFAGACAAKYLHLIISCNWATDDDWCGGCEKCAFVFLLFAAFLPVPDIMAKVFGIDAAPAVGSGCSGGCSKEDTSSPIVPGSRESLRGVYDMYDSERHVPVFESLMGLSGHKPFECVGTPEECLAAMYLACGRYGGGGEAQTAAASVGPGPGGGASAECCGGGEEACGAATAEAAGSPESGSEQQRRGCGKLPLLLRKHLGLICSKGKEEWEKIQWEMRRVAETWRASVPTLYPEWFRLGGAGAAEEGAELQA